MTATWQFTRRYAQWCERAEKRNMRISRDVDRREDDSIQFFETSIGNQSDSEDCVSDALTHAYEKRTSLRGASTLRTWLTSILNNPIIDVPAQAMAGAAAGAGAVQASRISTAYSLDVNF
jgi:Sigma-70 region 2